jgi:hypothetical protein
MMRSQTQIQRALVLNSCIERPLRSDARAAAGRRRVSDGGCKCMCQQPAVADGSSRSVRLRTSQLRGGLVGWSERFDVNGGWGGGRGGQPGRRVENSVCGWSRD